MVHTHTHMHKIYRNTVFSVLSNINWCVCVCVVFGCFFLGGGVVFVFFLIPGSPPPTHVHIIPGYADTADAEHQHWFLGGACSWPDHMKWRSTLNQHLKSGEEKLMNSEVGERARRKEHNNSNRPETTHKCDFCSREFLPHWSLQPQAMLQ